MRLRRLSVRLDLLVLLIAAFSPLAGAVAPTSETLTLTFATSPTGANYSPRNVHVVWAEDAKGNFVRTLGRWAAKRAGSLTQWKARAGEGDTDGVSGATQPNGSEYTLVWDLTRRGGGAIPDGKYLLRLELTSSNAPGLPRHLTAIPFEKNGKAYTVRLPDADGYSKMRVVYSGR